MAERLTGESETPPSASEQLQRKKAIKRAQDKRNFMAVLVAYFVINALIVTAWAIWDNHEEFWPGWTLGIWGLIMVSWGWDLYGRPRPVSEEAIQREIAGSRRVEPSPTKGLGGSRARLQRS